MALSDSSILNKIDDLFGNFTIRGEKKSSLIVYKEEGWSFKQLWKKDFGSNVNKGGRKGRGEVESELSIILIRLLAFIGMNN